jgi:hypothetical protein
MMTPEQLDAAIAEANRVGSKNYTPETCLAVAERAEEASWDTDGRTDPWLTESLDAERRFAQPHAKLFPFLGRKVRTPEGPGTLLQVFANRVAVLLDSQLTRCSMFHPREIQPVSPE